MLIYSMSVSVDGFIADREGAFGWTPVAVMISERRSQPPEHLVEPVLDRPQRAVDGRRALIVRN